MNVELFNENQYELESAGIKDPAEETCVSAFVTNFEKCDNCKSALIQLPLEQPISGNYRVEVIFEGMGGAGKVESPNGRFLEPEFAYQGWSSDDNGSIYAAYSTQNLCWNKVSRRFSLTNLKF